MWADKKEMSQSCIDCKLKITNFLRFRGNGVFKGRIVRWKVGTRLGFSMYNNRFAISALFSKTIQLITDELIRSH